MIDPVKPSKRTIPLQAMQVLKVGSWIAHQLNQLVEHRAMLGMDLKISSGLRAEK